MSREIKFRAWDKKSKCMAKLIGFKDLEKAIQVIYLDEDGDETFAIVDREQIELMQYTGLNDKNGKEIYEGDIVKAEESKIVCEVIYTEGAMFMLNWHDTKWGNDEYHHYGLGAFTLEVIGSIYENKDLLEGEK